MRYRTVAIAGMCLLATACQSGREGETVGTLLGAGAGALIGSQFGSGTGQLVAVGIGTAVGGLIGNQIGAYLDAQERQEMAVNTQQVLNSNQPTQQMVWQNPDTKRTYAVSTGAIQPQAGTGRECRPFTQEIIEKDGTRTTNSGRACRTPSGEWEIIA